MPIPISSRISFEPCRTLRKEKRTGWIKSDLVKFQYKTRYGQLCGTQTLNSKELHWNLRRYVSLKLIILYICCFFKAVILCLSEFKLFVSFLMCFCFWFFYSYSSLFFYFLTIFYDFSNISFFIKSNNCKITFIKGRKHRSKKRKMPKQQQNKRQDWKQKQKKRQKQRKKLE